MTEALLLDDDATMRLLLRAMLERLGWRVREADDVPTALARLHEPPPVHVALVDWMLAESTGIALVRAIRADVRLAHIKVIMVTSNNDLEQVTEALAAGADEYLMKPVSQDGLRSKLALVGLLDP